MLSGLLAGSGVLPITLSRGPDDLRYLFSRLNTFGGIADLLEVSYRQLGYYINAGRKYKVFEIPKKYGGKRQISAPTNALGIIQRKLNRVLQAVYSPRKGIHGFLPKRGILTNASQHTRSKYILNVDLADFFPNITFPRVRGMFMAKPYLLPANVATILARICCFDGSLPQGAPTSPVVSNMICARMDSELKKLAWQHKCVYTRYADDISFSTHRSTFPEALALFENEGEHSDVTAGPLLAEVVQRNGFKINDRKVRLQHHSKRQEVTGLIANKTPNVPRPYVRQVRAMLHAWRKYGLKSAGAEFFSKYDRKNRRDAPPDAFKNVVKGKIDFLGLVKGKQSRTYLAFLRQYASLDPVYTLPPELPTWETNLGELRKSVWAIRGDNGEGTAFYLHEVGIVTCAHVVIDNDNLVAFHPEDLSKEFKLKVKILDADRDVAILEFCEPLPSSAVFIPASEGAHVHDQVTLLGYPNFAVGSTGVVYPGGVIGSYVRFGQPRIQISAEIAQGNSGGPVLDRNYFVLGVAANGKERLGKRSDELYGVIPIDVVLSVVQDHPNARAQDV